jgi:hypothetical protein
MVMARVKERKAFRLNRCRLFPFYDVWLTSLELARLRSKKAVQGSEIESRQADGSGVARCLMEKATPSLTQASCEPEKQFPQEPSREASGSDCYCKKQKHNQRIKLVDHD